MKRWHGPYKLYELRHFLKNNEYNREMLWSFGHVSGNDKFTLALVEKAKLEDDKIVFYDGKCWRYANANYDRIFLELP
jgi:hypothetical protein